MKRKRINELSTVDILTQTEIEAKKQKYYVISIIIAVLAAIALVISLNTVNAVITMADKLPDKISLMAYKPDQTTLIYDVNDKLIANIHGDEDRVVVPLGKISPNLQKAVIATEDNRFYSHKGVDLVGTIRAVFSNLSGGGGSMQGGSTLTQQLVKNSFLTPERSIKRKILEAILAVRIENCFSKNKILEMYLNQIYWGSLSYGAEKAARKYFREPAVNLDLAESAFLAGLIRAPEAYSPYHNFKAAKSRQKLVLAKMEHYGYINHAQRIQAEKESLNIKKSNSAYSKYPYFVDYVSYLLRQKYGEDVVRRGGLKVYTTLNPKVQEIAEKTIKEGVKALSGGTGVEQGALVSINAYNGYIQALVGGIDFEKSNYNRAVYSKRAAGSSFKPIVYLTGLRLGVITPESPITDAPICLHDRWSSWSPHNWDGKYMGKMTIRKALTLSRNTPTVRIALKTGLDEIIKTARLLGIKGEIDKNYSFVLGSLGVSPLEMATVYSTFARSGVFMQPTAIRRVEDSDHHILESNKPLKTQVVSGNFVRQLDSILVDVVEKGTGKPAKLEDRQVAGKTGTTDSVKDIWFTGFTPDTVTSIWLGNDKNTKLTGVFSSNCAQLWHVFSTEYYKVMKIPPRKFPLPDEMKAKINEEKTNKEEDSELKKQN